MTWRAGKVSIVIGCFISLQGVHSKRCPSQDVFQKVKETYRVSQGDPKNRSKMREFVRNLELLMHKSGCRRTFDTDDVPAIWMCGDRSDLVGICSSVSTAEWYRYLASSKFAEASRLFGSELFRSTLDGDLGEEFRGKSLRRKN